MATKTDLLTVYERERLHIIAHVHRQHGIALEDVEDALQEVLCKLLEKWTTKRATLQEWSQEELVGFLIVAVRNQAIDTYRQIYGRNRA